MSSVEHYLLPDWPAPPGINAASTLRTGGVSAGPFASLNLAHHVGDDIRSVMRNRRLIIDMLELPSEPFWLEQIHGDHIVRAAKSAIKPPQADASFTDEPNVVCAVMTADCLPVLICSRDGKKVAAVHAGWRGMSNGIVRNAVAALNESEIMVWLGPAIGPGCFEVGDDVRAVFVHKSPAFVAAFQPIAKSKWLADIYQLARIELKALGVTAVYGGQFCTATEQERFFSYRRDRLTGRMATLIWRD